MLYLLCGLCANECDALSSCARAAYSACIGGADDAFGEAEDSRKTALLAVPAGALVRADARALAVLAAVALASVLTKGRALALPTVAPASYSRCHLLFLFCRTQCIVLSETVILCGIITVDACAHISTIHHTLCTGA